MLSQPRWLSAHGKHAEIVFLCLKSPSIIDFIFVKLYTVIYDCYLTILFFFIVHICLNLSINFCVSVKLSDSVTLVFFFLIFIWLWFCLCFIRQYKKILGNNLLNRNQPWPSYDHDLSYDPNYDLSHDPSHDLSHDLSHDPWIHRLEDHCQPQRWMHCDKFNTQSAREL